MEALYPSISPVNTFRVVLNEVLGLHLPRLEDRHYLASYEEPFHFEEVAPGRVRKRFEGP